MLKFFICYFCLLLQISTLFSCPCYDKILLDNIQTFQSLCKKTAETELLYDLADWRKKDPWELAYFKDCKEVVVKHEAVRADVYRFPTVYLKLLTLENRVDVVSNYLYEKAWQRYLGPEAGYWAYSLAEKEAKVSIERQNLSKRINKTKEFLENKRNEIVGIYQELYEKCLQNHTSNSSLPASLNTYYDYGLLARLYNNYDISMNMLHRLMDEAERSGKLDSLDSHFYHELGSACVEAQVYEKGIEYLSEAIRQDPENKAVYFDRAVAYFETGNFDLAQFDYMSSVKDNSTNLALTSVSNEFSSALMTSLMAGAQEAAVEFVPSMCSSAYGLGEALWAGLEHPIDSGRKFIASCHEVSTAIHDFCQDVDWSTLDGYVENVKTLYENYNQLSESEKGQLIGHTIGKYGVDIFAGGAVLKSINAARNLREANRLCNLEALASNQLNNKKLVVAAGKHATERNSYFKNVKLLLDDQNKHIPGKHNYMPGKSIVTHPDPESLLRNHAGTGRAVRGTPCEPSYHEIVDFRETIGIHINNKTGIQTPTSYGKIHYSKKGAHIVPALPIQ